MKICSKPCKECPFTKSSSPGWLGDYESPIQLHQLIMSEIPFPCHLSHENDISVLEAMKDNLPRCKGALLYMKKAAKWPRNNEVQQIIQSIKPDELENILSVPEFIKHHTI